MVFLLRQNGFAAALARRELGSASVPQTGYSRSHMKVITSRAPRQQPSSASQRGVKAAVRRRRRRGGVTPALQRYKRWAYGLLDMAALSCRGDYPEDETRGRARRAPRPARFGRLGAVVDPASARRLFGRRRRARVTDRWGCRPRRWRLRRGGRSPWRRRWGGGRLRRHRSCSPPVRHGRLLSGLRLRYRTVLRPSDALVQPARVPVHCGQRMPAREAMLRFGVRVGGVLLGHGLRHRAMLRPVNPYLQSHDMSVFKRRGVRSREQVLRRQLRGRFLLRRR